MNNENDLINAADALNVPILSLTRKQSSIMNSAINSDSPLVNFDSIKTRNQNCNDKNQSPIFNM